MGNLNFPKLGICKIYVIKNFRECISALLDALISDELDDLALFLTTFYRLVYELNQRLNAVCVKSRLVRRFFFWLFFESLSIRNFYQIFRIKRYIKLQALFGKC